MLGHAASSGDEPHIKLRIQRNRLENRLVWAAGSQEKKKGKSCPGFPSKLANQIHHSTSPGTECVRGCGEAWSWGCPMPAPGRGAFTWKDHQKWGGLALRLTGGDGHSWGVGHQRTGECLGYWAPDCTWHWLFLCLTLFLSLILYLLFADLLHRLCRDHRRLDISGQNKLLPSVVRVQWGRLTWSGLSYFSGSSPSMLSRHLRAPVTLVCYSPLCDTPSTANLVLLLSLLLEPLPTILKLCTDCSFFKNQLIHCFIPIRCSYCTIRLFPNTCLRCNFFFALSCVILLFT